MLNADPKRRDPKLTLSIICSWLSVFSSFIVALSRGPTRATISLAAALLVASITFLIAWVIDLFFGHRR